MTEMHLDYETRSRVNLKTDGVYNYAGDASTEVTAVCYCFDDGPVKTWRIWHGDAVPEDFAEHFMRANEDPYANVIYAHNAGFERLITWHVLLRDYPSLVRPPLESFICTAAQARANALPGALGDVCRALNTHHKKDMAGHRLMMSLCKPNALDEWNEDPADMERQYEYCAQDVETERDIHTLMRKLTDAEIDQYHSSERINDRGLLIDVDVARNAQLFAARETEEISQRLAEITGGVITTPRQFKSIKEWFLGVGDKHTHCNDQGNITKISYTFPQARVNPVFIDTIMHYKDGEQKFSLDKDARYNLLTMHGEDPDLLALTDDQLEVIQLLDDAGNSSVAKFKSMESRCDKKLRVRGAYMFSGAGQTGRYSSVGLQMHNLRRDCYTGEQAEDVADAIALHHAPEEVTRIGTITDREGNESVPNIMTVLAKMLRPTIIAAEDKMLVCGDWSNIEARGLPWLSNDPRAEAVLDNFRQGLDPYIPEAAKIFRVSPEEIGKDDPRRQLGKVAVLSLGFGGAEGAFISMARNYQIKISKAKATPIVRAWREANPWAVNFWHELREAATQAVASPGQVFRAGRVRYLCSPQSNFKTLWCLLPSHRLLAYPDVRHEYLESRWGDMEWVLTAMKGNLRPKKEEKHWPRMPLWHGILAENITQAICADLLRECIQRWEDREDTDHLPIVGHTHDELLLEVDEVHTREAYDLLQEEMCRVPEWATDFPIDAELWTGVRYRK